MKRVEPPVVSGFACLCVAVTFVAGLVRLGMELKEIQIDDAAGYSYANIRQSVRRVQTAGLRGRILGRHGEVLAANRKSVSIVCQPSSFQKRTWEETAANIEAEVARIAAVIGKGSPLSPKAVRRHIRQSLAMPLVVWRDIGEGELAVFSEHEHEFPGFSVSESVEREYPMGQTASHVVGYVGRDRGESEAGDEKINFFATEMRGRSGLEAYYDSFLRGVPGERKLLVDARGFAIRGWTVAPSQAGPDLRLSLDMSVQRAVERQLRGEVGACAVINPVNGEVLALASSPCFDPNDFVPSLTPDVYDRYAGDARKPLLNRASGGLYAPGSTFKPITAMAGLAAGVPPEETYDCTGVFSLGSLNLRCSSLWGHGALDMRHAIMRSCNPFFCSLGMTVGTNALFRTAAAFGLGQRTGIDFGVDAAGVVPDGDWKLRTYGERWYPGDLAQMSIGQGMLLATPLQMARATGAIATGSLVTPHLKIDVPVERVRLPFDDAKLAVLREGMRLVVSGDGGSRGTGWRAGEGVAVPVAGKTGTAEIGVGERRRKNVWFVAYAPADNPTVAIAMVIENGDSGGATAAPKVGSVLKTVFGEARR